MTAREFLRLVNLCRNQRICLYAVGGISAEMGTMIGTLLFGERPGEAVNKYMGMQVKGFDFNLDRVNIYVDTVGGAGQ